MTDAVHAPNDSRFFAGISAGVNFVDQAVHGALIDAHPDALDNRLTLVQTYVLKGPPRPVPWHRRLLDRLRGRRR